MNLPTTKPNDRDLAWYVRECEALQCINAALRAQANDEFDAVITRNMELERENSKLWAELEKATCGKTTCSECGKPVNNAWRDEDGHHCLTCLADERNALREAKDAYFKHNNILVELMTEEQKKKALEILMSRPKEAQR